MYKAISRRWFTFSLRTLLLSVTLTAIACPPAIHYYREYKRKARERELARQKALYQRAKETPLYQQQLPQFDQRDYWGVASTTSFATDGPPQGAGFGSNAHRDLDIGQIYVQGLESPRTPDR